MWLKRPLSGTSKFTIGKVTGIINLQSILVDGMLCHGSLTDMGSTFCNKWRWLILKQQWTRDLHIFNNFQVQIEIDKNEEETPVQQRCTRQKQPALTCWLCDQEIMEGGGWQRTDLIGMCLLWLAAEIADNHLAVSVDFLRWNESFYFEAKMARGSSELKTCSRYYVC